MVGLEDVAKLANVSAATASRALSRPDMVAEATRERVTRAAAQLGYQPNVLARSLRQQRSRTVGLIITDILNPFFANVAKGAQDAASQHGHTMFLFNTDEEPEKERLALQSLRGQLPVGLLIVPTPRTASHACYLTGLPVIALDRRSGLDGEHSVLTDNVGGARQATEHLIRLGHRRIGTIIGPLEITTARERHQGYCEAIDAAGLAYDPALVLTGNYRAEDGRQAALRLLSAPADLRPTALFVGNGEMTYGTVLAMRELGLRFPGDVSLICFDDSHWAQTIQPPLTVVEQPAYDLGYQAAETLFGVLKADQLRPPVQLRLPTRLIQRSSTAPPVDTPTYAGPAP